MTDPTQSDPTRLDSSCSQSTPPDSSGAAPSTGKWLVRLPVAARVDRLAELNDDLIRAGRPSRGRRVLLAAARLAVTFGIGVAATLAWQPYGDAARMMIAHASPQLGWLAPHATYRLASVAVNPPARSVPPAGNASPPRAPSLDLDTVRERIDHIATTQEQMTRIVAQLTAGQAQIAREITKVREVEQYLLYKTAYDESSHRREETASTRPATASAHKSMRRRSSAR